MKPTGTPGASATAALWERRDRRVPAVVAAVALTGLPASILEDAARVSFTLSCEFEALLEGMQERTRQLPSVLQRSPERCLHSVRGPVMWSETLTARANSFGAEDVFVCATVRRSFDCAENRLLVWLLDRAASAGRLLRRRSGASGIVELMDPGEIRRTEEIGASARAWRMAPRLVAVSGREPDRHELDRIRSKRGGGAEKSVLLAARGRAKQPFASEEIASLCDPVTSEGHAEVLDALRGQGGPGSRWGCSRRALTLGGLVWQHRANGGSGRVQPADP